MLNRIGGTLAAIAVVGIVVWTAMGRGKYSSMVFADAAEAETVQEMPDAASGEDSVRTADSLSAVSSAAAPSRPGN